MDGVELLAQMLKERENNLQYSPVEGIVTELPDIKIRITEKIIPGREMIRSIVNLCETDSNGNYKWLGRRVYLLPFFSTDMLAIQRYLVIGGDEI